MTQRVPLNPADALFSAMHRAMAATGQGGYVAMFCLDVQGELDSAALRTALERCFLAHPVLMAQLEDNWLGRQYWLLPPEDARSRSASLAARRALEEFDLRDEGAGEEAALEALMVRNYRQDRDFRGGPQIHLDMVRRTGDRVRLIMRWPHHLLDGPGVLWLYQELGRLMDPSELPEDLPEGLLPDHEIPRPLAGLSWRERWTLFWAAVGGDPEMRDVRKQHATQLVGDDRPPLGELGVLHRRIESEQMRQVKANAKRFVPAGPGYYARWVAVAVMRALGRIFEELGSEGDGIEFNMPANILHETGISKRPLPGNYLVAPMMWGRPELLGDRRGLAADHFAQLQRYDAARGPLQQWVALAFFAKLPSRLCAWLLRQSFKGPSMSSGFSYLGEGVPSVRRIGRAEVVALWGAGPLPTPPGWNPAFATFDGHLEMTLTYPRPAVSDATAKRFMEFIAEELLVDAEPIDEADERSRTGADPVPSSPPIRDARIGRGL